jgi:hypothetical protein
MTLLFPRRFAALFLMLALGGALTAQHQELQERPHIWRGHQYIKEDSGSLLHAFKKGSMEGHFRYFLCVTDNKPGLTDYHAQATGGGIRYETAPFHGFRFALSGFFIFDLGSSNLAQRDPKTGQPNRYEIGLFDAENANNRNDINRVEELYLSYTKVNTRITYGKQLINTPFINLQDGRMRPTGVEGIWLDSRVLSKLRIEGGWIGAVSPRGTVRWFDGGASIGVYPVGLNPDGTPSGYAGNVQSKGVGMLGLDYKPSASFNLQQWNMWIEGVSYSALAQVNFMKNLPGNRQFGASIQTITQHALGAGGNEDPQKTYMSRGARSFTFGAKTSFRTGAWEHSLNYNRITAVGRYLVPREWGRDPFFTFLPRERNDGLGDVHALVLKSGWTSKNRAIKYNLGGGYYRLPDVRNTRLNKYGMPSYVQLNSDLRYQFRKGFLQGLDAQLLVVVKRNAGEIYQNLKYVFNKTDMVLYNLILNYHF